MVLVEVADGEEDGGLACLVFEHAAEALGADADAGASDRFAGRGVVGTAEDVGRDDHQSGGGGGAVDEGPSTGLTHSHFTHRPSTL
jgi:hypothetical protein